MILNEEAINKNKVSQEYINYKKREIGKEIEGRCRDYKGKYEQLDLKNRIVILTDDGIATGFTTKAAIDYIKSEKPKKIILAVPVAPLDATKEFGKQVDEFVCLHSAAMFFSISQFYESFPQLEDKEVKKYLKNSKEYSK